MTSGNMNMFNILISNSYIGYFIAHLITARNRNMSLCSLNCQSTLVLISLEDDGNLLKVRTFSALAVDEWKQQILHKVSHTTLLRVR